MVRQLRLGWLMRWILRYAAVTWARGRAATPAAYEHLGLRPPEALVESLF